jgi:AcrR family transcriptional regulator
VSTVDTRRRILGAALSAFVQDGYEHTTIAGIRRRSEVSNGALFHHFPSKEAIADALHVDAIASFHEGLWDLLGKRPRSLRSAIRGTVEHQMRWVEENPDLARFLYMRGHLDWSSPGGAQVADLNRELAGAFREWMAPFVGRGELRARSMTMVTAIVGGPAHAIAQRWLAGHIDAPPRSFVDELADAAWAGLRGKPTPAHAQPPAEPHAGRLTFELVAGDGSIMARGAAIAELVPEGPAQHDQGA